MSVCNEKFRAFFSPLFSLLPPLSILTCPPVLPLWHFLTPLAPRCLASRLHLYDAALLLLDNQSAAFLSLVSWTGLRGSVL